jgi:UDP-glucose 4-epimerase
MRIAVTGASGFVGRACVERLRRERFDVVAITRSIPNGFNVESGFSVCDDYSDSRRLAELFTGCHAVIHLAARAHQLADIPSVDMIKQYRQANVVPVISVAEAATRAGVDRVVFVSSIGVNGNSTHGCAFTESDPPSPVEPYALTKLEAEKVLANRLARGHTDWVIVRPPLVYGPGCPGNLLRLMNLASSAPLLPFASIRASRTLISLDNLLDVLLLASCHSAVSRRIFLVSDVKDVDMFTILRAFLRGLGRESWRLVPFPPLVLKLMLRLVGRAALWSKFAAELRVDCSAFRDATGWSPSVDPEYGLMLAASSFFNQRQ